MNTDINPQFPYYLLLYILTIMLRCIRAYRNRPDKKERTDEQVREYQASFFFFSFELVNVSAGVFILLTEHASKYVGAVMILYVILVIVGFFLEDDKVDRKVKVAGHSIVSVVIFCVTFYAFFGVEDLKASEKDLSKEVISVVPQSVEQSPKVQETTWRVALPYMDAGLNRNFGVKSTPIQSFFLTTVPGKTRREAIGAAKKEFYSERGPLPFVDKMEKNVLSMIIIEDSIVVEPID